MVGVARFGGGGRVGEVILDGLRVLLPHGAVEGMGVGSESHVGCQGPVFQVVARFEANAREVGDLVAGDAEGGEALDGKLVEVGSQIVTGDVGGAIADSAEEALFAEAAVFVDFEHVDGDVWGSEALDPVERFAPTGGGLAGKSGDQVEIQIGDAGFAEDGDVGSDDGGGVAAAGAAEFIFDEGLNAEADTVDA